MTRRQPRSASTAGFTLVELMVALVLLALISTLLVGALRFAHTAWARSDLATERLQRDEMGMSLLRRTVQNAYAFSVPGSAPGPNQLPIATFDGNADSLVFLAPSPAVLGLGGVQLTWLTIERQGGAARVVLRWRSFERESEGWLPDLNKGAGMAQLVVLDHLPGAALSYFGADAQPGSPPHWRNEWVDSGTLPSLVKLTFTAAALPDLVIAPRRGNASGVVATAPAGGN